MLPSSPSAEEDNGAKPKDGLTPSLSGPEQPCVAGETSIENSSECVSIPVEFATKNVWPFVPTVSSSTDLAGDTPPNGTPRPGASVDHGIIFPPGFMAHARARFHKAFSDYPQLAAASETSEKIGPASHDTMFTLFSPHKELSVIDSFVRQIASSQEADVVVLDSIEFLRGGGNLLGKKLCEIVQKINHCTEMSDFSERLRCRDPINQYLRALVAVDPPISLVDTPTNNTRAPSDIPTGTTSIIPSDGSEDKKITPCFRRRIIYLRDFGAISFVAGSFLEGLMAAIRLHRKASIQGPGLEDPSRLHRVVLVMGMSRPLKSDHDWKCFQSGGSHLYELLPRIDTGRWGIPGLYLLRAFTRSYLERERAAPPTPKRDMLQWEDPPSSIDSIDEDVPTCRYSDSLYGTVIAVFKPDLSPKCSEDWEVEKEERLSILNDSILRGAIDEQDGLLEGENLFKTILGTRAACTGNEVTDNNASVESSIRFAGELRQRVLPHWLGERLASSACLLAHSAAHSCSIASDSPSLPPVSSSIDTTSASSSRRVVVTAEIAGQAWDMIGVLGAERRDFVKANGFDVVSDVAIRDSKLEKLKRESVLNKYEQVLLSCVVDPAELTTKFEDVCISQTIIDAIHSIVTFPLMYPSAYRGGVLKSESMSGILLYGPPGTGKTLLCKAVAKRCNTHMLQITSASVQSKWIGETEKYIKAIFSLARRLGPCIIFIDEVDALFRDRNGSHGSSSHQSSMLAEFMQEMDGLQSSGTNKEKGIIVIGCTNRPYDLDDAVLRRLPRRLLVDLPRFKERGRILTALLREEELDDIDISEIARRTKHFSGSDLKHLCVAAALASVQEMHDTISGTMNKSENDGHPPDLPPRILSPRHFAAAFAQVSSSCSEDLSSVRLLRKWAGTFASGLNSGVGLVDSDSD